jgi:branched-chain amino acid transport system ATP-binding protein
MTVLLHAQGIGKRFGGVRAVRSVSIAVQEHTVLALIGPNGAGKSTLLNLLSGVHQPDSGTLEFDGRDLIGLPAHQRVRLGIARTFQKIRLFKQLTVLENVLTGFHIRHALAPWQYVLHGAAFRRDAARCRAEAMELLAFAGLSARAGDRAGALPYGQQRMLEIARSMATRPRLLMLDEPAAGLNAAEVHFLLQRLEDIARRGVTLVVVEHNMDLVMNVAQRVYVMQYGEQLFEGTPREVQSNARVVEAYLGGEFA